jgi:hypothetical protein
VSEYEGFAEVRPGRTQSDQVREAIHTLLVERKLVS